MGAFDRPIGGLQSIGESVRHRQQLDLAVGLDVIVVIVGIFLGLQVSDWNDERLERVEERAYLERFHSEVMTSLNFSEENFQKI